MDKTELSQKMASLLLEYSSDPKHYLDPLLLMFAQIEKDLYWEQELTPPPSDFMRFITLLDTLENGIIEWFRNGNWRFDDRKFISQGGPRLQKIDREQDIIKQLIPIWLQEKLLPRYSSSYDETDED
jgi:hypothetical protein